MGWTFYNASGQQLRNTGTVLATQAEMEAGSSTAAFVTPGRTQYHPGVAKVWVKWEQSGDHDMLVSHNMTSVTDGDAAGITDHVFAVDFSSAHYVVVVGGGGDNRLVFADHSSYAAGTLTTHTREASSAGLTDDDTNCMAIFGDQ